MMIPVLAVGLLLLHGALGDIPNACPASPDENATLCRFDECVAIADELLETMNSSRDPCENFYQYACGGWLDQQFLNPQRTRVTTFVSDLPLALTRKFLAEAPTPTDLPSVKKAKDLYASCVNYTEPTTRQYYTVTDLLQNRLSLGRRVCTYSLYYCNIETFQLVPSLKDVFKLGVHLLFTMRADPNSFTDASKRNQRSFLYIGKPVLGMPIDRYELLFRHESYRNIYAAKIVTEVAKFNTLRQTNIQDALEIVDVEVTLAMIYNNLTTKGESRMMTLMELTTEYGQLINWTRFVIDLASSPEIGITDITSQELVIVNDPQYFRGMADYFTGLSKSIQKKYFYWRVIDSLQYALIEDHRKLKYFLSEASQRLGPHPYTELDCVKYVSGVFDLVVHRFLYKALTTDTTHMVRNIIKWLRSEFKIVVNGLTWMDSDVKDVVIGKLDSLQTIFAFHENSMNDSVLDSYFANITVNANDFMISVIRARKAAFERDFKNIRRTREADPTALPHQFLAEYSRPLNKLYISPIVLHHPFFNTANYWSLIFAGFATVVAQEIMHGYDTTGYHYNSDGVYGNWWRVNVSEQFHRNAQCLVNQYNSFNYSTAGRNVNGVLTLDSNIADVTGLKIAYRAFKAYIVPLFQTERLPGVTLSNDQMFFVKFAQMRCTKETQLAALSTLSGKKSPDEFRVNGPLRNLDEFATAFNCSADSFMNPPNKCKVW